MESNLMYYEYYKWLNYNSLYEEKELEKIDGKYQLDDVETAYLNRNEEYKNIKELFRKYIKEIIEPNEEDEINQFMENHTIDSIIKDKISINKYNIYMKTVDYYKNYDLDKLNGMIENLEKMEEIDKVNDDEYITFMLYQFRKLKVKKLKKKVLVNNKTL